MTNLVVPTRVGERIATLDVLRGIAICGILLMNIPEMGMLGKLGRPSLPAAANVDWIAWGVQTLLFEGTMRGLFTMLFGAGMLLMLRRAEGPAPEVSPIDVWTRRCLALMALGIVNWLVLLWPGEILWNYGVTGLVLLAFRTARPRTLFIAGLVCVAGLTVSDARTGYTRATKMQASLPAVAARAAGRPLTPPQKEAVAGYDRVQGMFHPKPDALAKDREQRTHWRSLVAWSWGIWHDNNLGDTGWFIVPESLAFMLIGMALFRTGVLTGDAPRGTYLWLLAIGYGGGLAIRLAHLMGGVATGFEFRPGAYAPWLQALRNCDYEPARLLMTLGHLGAIVLLFRGGALGRAAPLRALGRMALTTYMAQSLITSVLFYGFGIVGRIGFAGLMATAVAIWLVTGAFALAWLRGHAMGPVESLLRGVAYGSFSLGRRRRQADAVLAGAPAI